MRVSQPRIGLRRRIALLPPIGAAHRAKRSLLDQWVRLLAALPYTELEERYLGGRDERQVVVASAGYRYEVMVEGALDDHVSAGGLRILVTVTDLPARLRPISDGFVMDSRGTVVGRIAVMHFHSRNPRSTRPA